MKWAVAALMLVTAVAAAIAWYLGYFPNHVDDLKFVSLQPIPSASARQNLRVIFRSNENLRALAERSGTSGLWALFSFCPWHRNPSLSLGRVEHNGIDLGTSPAKLCFWQEGRFKQCKMVDDTPQVRAETANARRGNGPYFYEVRFTYRERWVSYKAEYGGTTQRRYPLPSSFRDICVKIDGYDDPPGLQGNIIVIPKTALQKALGDFKPKPLDQKKWNDTPSELACAPRSFSGKQRLTLRLSPKHGPNLAVHRLWDNTWWVIVSNEAPIDVHSLMSERAFSETRGLDLDSGITGFQWWAAASPQQRIFTRTGNYLIYVPAHGDENLESDRAGFGCIVHYSIN